MPRVSDDAKMVTPPPAATADRPPPPAHLGARERAEWQAIIERMGANLLPRETYGLLETFVAAKVQLQTINQALAEFGIQVPQEKERWRRYQDLTRMRG